MNFIPNERVKLPKLILASLIAVSIPAFTQEEITKDDLAPDPIVAKVNGVNIYRSQLTAYYEDNLKFVYNKEVTIKSSLNEMANRIIGIDKAKKTGVDEDPIVKERIKDILFHAQISKDLEGKLKAITVSDDEVKEYYKSHTEHRVAQILFRLRAVPSRDEVEKQLKLSLDVYNELRKKPDAFPVFAQKFSQANTYSAGGDSGFQPAVRLGPAIHKAIQGKIIGTMTEPIRTPYGFHIVKILGKKDFKDIDTNLYKKIIYDSKRDKIMNDYFTAERKSGKIEILDKSLK